MISNQLLEILQEVSRNGKQQALSLNYLEDIERNFVLTGSVYELNMSSDKRREFRQLLSRHGSSSLLTETPDQIKGSY